MADEKSLKDIEINYLLSFYSLVVLQKKTSSEINDLYTRQKIIETLKTRGFDKNDLQKWSLDKLKKEHKSFLIHDNCNSQDICDSLLFDILSYD